MNSSELKHSYEVTGYWRKTPSGKSVWVPGYYKKGSTVRQDELSENRRRAEVAEAQSRRNTHDASRHAAAYLKRANMGYQKEDARYYHNKYAAERKKASDEHFKDKLALEKAQGEEARGQYDNESLDTTIRLEALNVAEDVKIAVHNAVLDIKSDVSDIIETSRPVVKAAIDAGVRMVTSFFSRLFGRR